jgi:hypothetical protein
MRSRRESPRSSSSSVAARTGDGPGGVDGAQAISTSKARTMR